MKDGIDLITDADAALTNLLSYPLHATLSRSVKAIYWIKFVDLSFLFPSLPTTFLFMIANAFTLVNSYDCLLLFSKALLNYSLIFFSDEAKPVVQDKISEVALGLISAYDNGEFTQALAEGRDGWQKWVKGFGKSLKRKVCHDSITFFSLLCF